MVRSEIVLPVTVLRLPTKSYGCPILATLEPRYGRPEQ